MTWKLEEFFKDKNECLMEINRFGNLYKKLELFKRCDLENENNLFSFLNFYEKYEALRDEFESYIKLLEMADYHNNDSVIIRTKFKQISSKIENIIDDIFNDIVEDDLLKKHNKNPEYRKYKKIVDDYYFKGEDEVERTYNTFDMLMKEIITNDVNIMYFKHTFLEIINNYFVSLKENLDGKNYEEYIFGVHEELEKEDFVNLTNLVKQNSLVNSRYFSIATEYIPKNIKIGYENAKHIVQDALTPLGMEYKSLLYVSLNDDSIDYQKRKYKSKDNCTYMPTNHRAFVNINYSDDIESVLTLAHEAGHMLSHNIKQKNNRGMGEVQNPICEFYSLTNELLVGNELLKKANTLDEKISISYELINTYYINLFMALFHADLSLQIGNEINKKSYIDMKSITSLSSKMIKKYNLFNEKGIWIDSSLFECINSIYYTYGIIGASNICEAINNKTFNVKDYIEILKKKCSNDFELYDILGCNPTKLYTIQKAMDNYSNLIENTRDLVYEKKKRR